MMPFLCVTVSSCPFGTELVPIFPQGGNDYSMESLLKGRIFIRSAFMLYLVKGEEGRKEDRDEMSSVTRVSTIVEIFEIQIFSNENPVNCISLYKFSFFIQFWAFFTIFSHIFAKKSTIPKKFSGHSIDEMKGEKRTTSIQMSLVERYLNHLLGRRIRDNNLLKASTFYDSLNKRSFYSPLTYIKLSGS